MNVSKPLRHRYRQPASATKLTGRAHRQRCWPPRASQHAKGIPVDLDAICFKAMAHDPWNRYTDCDQLADDLDRFLRGDLIHGRRIGWIERARHFSKRNPKIAAWSTAAAVAGVALLLASSAYAVRTQFVVRYLDKENQRIERDAQQSVNQLSLLVLSATNGQWVQRLQSHRHGVNGLAFNADGSQLASSGDDGRVLLWQLGTDQPVAEYDCQGDRPNSLRLSPDGQRFAFVAATTGTKYLTQTRTRTVNVSKYRVEERTREYQVEFTRMESKTISRDVDYDGHLVKQEYSVLVPTTAMETKTVTDAVQVPYTEQVEQTYTVPVPVTEAFSSNPNGDRPRVIAVSASDLQEQGRWYPEGNRTPYALTFADSGRRMFVSTDRGVSVLHPGYLFELVDLLPRRCSGTTALIRSRP